MNYMRNRQPIVAVGVILLFIVMLIVTRGSGPVNPNNDKELTADEGRDSAVLYMQGAIFNAVDGDEYVMSQIRKDLLTFARITRAEFADRNTLVAFTFDKDSKKDSPTHVYTGQYYGVGDRIEVKLTPQGKGVYTLSITNQADQTNIDQFLTMNGPRHEFIRTLPVESSNYSIRYLGREDTILVTFLNNYTSADVDAVEKLLIDGRGSVYEDGTRFNLNRVGNMTLDAIRSNLANPIPIPLR